MLSLEEFKNMLIEGLEGDKDAILSELERQLDDAKLQKIIDDTYDFIKEFLNKAEAKSGWVDFEFDDSNTNYFFWCRLPYTDYNKNRQVEKITFYNIPRKISNQQYEERVISPLIMYHVFENKLSTQYIENERQADADDPDVEIWDTYYTFRFEDFPVDRLDIIKEKLFGSARNLTPKKEGKN